MIVRESRMRRRRRLSSVTSHTSEPDPRHSFSKNLPFGQDTVDEEFTPKPRSMSEGLVVFSSSWAG